MKNPPLSQYHAKVYCPQQNRGGSTDLKRSKTAVKQFIEFLNYDPCVLDVQPAQVDAFIAKCQANGLSEPGQEDKKLKLRAVLRHAGNARFAIKVRSARKESIALPECPSGEQKLSEVFEKQFAPQKLRGKVEHTFRLYRLALREFSIHLGYQATLKDLNDSSVSSYLARVESEVSWNTGKKRSARTVNNRRSYMLSFWRWCARKRLVELFPDVEMLPEPVTQPKAWTKEQLAKLMKAISEEPGKAFGVPAALGWKTLHLVLWDTGERITATLSIEWEWMDLDTGVLCIPAHARKGGRKPMTYHLKPITVEAIREIKASQQPERELVFPGWDKKDRIYSKYKRILKRAGLPADRESMFHRMRKTFASHVEAAGGNATDALDHFSRATTKKSYIDPTIVKQAPANTFLFAITEGGE